MITLADCIRFAAFIGFATVFFLVLDRIVLAKIHGPSQIEKADKEN
jgi:hypothetical protein